MEIKTRFLPGTSLFLPAGDMGGEIKPLEYSECNNAYPRYY